MIKTMIKRTLRRFPSLAGYAKAAADYRAGNLPLRETPFGFRLAGPDGMVAGCFERFETAMIPRLLVDCCCLVNIGANVGYYCCLAAQAGKPVLAFEPLESNVRLLLRNVEANGFASLCEIHPVAVGAGPDVLRLYGGGTMASLVPGWGGIPADLTKLVPVMALDPLVRGRFPGEVPLMLIDVEGAELQVLRGAVELLAREPKPVWVIEVCISEHQPDGATLSPHFLETFDHFFARGYEVWSFVEQPARIEREGLVRIAESGHDHLGTHNFICFDPAYRARFLAAAASKVAASQW